MILILFLVSLVLAETLQFETVGVAKYKLLNYTVTYDGDNRSVGEKPDEYEFVRNASDWVSWKFINGKKVIIYHQNGKVSEYEIKFLYLDEKNKCYDVVREKPARVCFNFELELLNWYQKPFYHDNVISWEELYSFRNPHLEVGERW